MDNKQIDREKIGRFRMKAHILLRHFLDWAIPIYNLIQIIKERFKK